MRFLPVAVLSILLLSACGHEPIYNVQSRPLPYAATSLSMSQIEAAIAEGGQARGWIVKAVAPGKMRAIQDQPKYAAEVEIAFDQKAYSINHVTTRGMEQKNDQVHAHYNFWIRNLQADIDAALSRAGVKMR